MLKYIFSIFFSLVSLFTLAQGEANNWYFGFGAGITFNTTPPSALTDGMLSTDEGCSSISDAAGNLLFYSNGETIYNRNHQIMENGTGLDGHFSSTQSALIVPQPLSPNLYLIFTIGAEAGFNGSDNGLSYSIIDIELDNGNGAVIEKNIQLLNYTTEKQTAVRHANGRDIWIITHLFESNAFYSFLITCNGVQPDPIISYVGQSHIEPNLGCCEATSTLGCMKSSPDNTKVAVVWSVLTGLDTQAGLVMGDWHLELFDLDNSTGKLSNPIAMSYGNNSNINKSYGVCFSPDNTKLYQTAYQGVPSNKLFQYDLTVADIPASQTIITEEYIKAFGTMEIGPNGKIYIARTNGHKFLSVLNNPNASGVDVDYEKEGISLEGINSTWGLPNILYDYSFQPVFDFFPADSTICEDESIWLEMESLNADSYLWSDGSIFSNNTIQSSGWHWLDVNSENCGDGRDSIYVTMEDCSCEVIFPNAFSPNGDNENDVFQPVRANCNYDFYDLKIFSRWGEVVFATNDKNQSWDGFSNGKKNTVGVYVFYLKYRSNGNKKSEQVIGDVSLMW